MPGLTIGSERSNRSGALQGRRQKASAGAIASKAATRALVLVERILKKCGLIVGSSVDQLKRVVCLYSCAKDSGIEGSTSQLGSNQEQV